MKNKAFEELRNLRNAFNERGDKEKKILRRWEAEEEKRWHYVNKVYDAFSERMDTVRSTDDIERRFQERQEDHNRRIRSRGDINDPNSGNCDEITPEIRNLAFQVWLISQIEMSFS